jgi:hypothetical protein
MMSDDEAAQSNVEEGSIPDDTSSNDCDFDLHPTGNEEDGWDYGDASPDDDLDNADWPKRTPDTMAAIHARIATAPRKLLFLRGSCWYVWLDYKTLEWTTDNDDAQTTKAMLGNEFSPGVIRRRGESDEAMRALYDDAVAFLHKAGVKVRVLD